MHRTLILALVAVLPACTGGVGGDTGAIGQGDARQTIGPEGSTPVPRCVELPRLSGEHTLAVTDGSGGGPMLLLVDNHPYCVGDAQSVEAVLPAPVMTAPVPGEANGGDPMPVQGEANGGDPMPVHTDDSGGTETGNMPDGRGNK